MATNRRSRVHRLWELAVSEEAIIYLSDSLLVNSQERLSSYCFLFIALMAHIF